MTAFGFRLGLGYRFFFRFFFIHRPNVSTGTLAVKQPCKLQPPALGKEKGDHPKKPKAPGPTTSARHVGQISRRSTPARSIITIGFLHCNTHDKAPTPIDIEASCVIMHNVDIMMVNVLQCLGWWNSANTNNYKRSKEDL